MHEMNFIFLIYERVYLFLFKLKRRTNIYD
nr:MAG TPA: hypothetical protein [Caudoviricetes sp.]